MIHQDSGDGKKKTHQKKITLVVFAIIPQIYSNLAATGLNNLHRNYI